MFITNLYKIKMKIILFFTWVELSRKTNKRGSHTHTYACNYMCVFEIGILIIFYFKFANYGNVEIFVWRGYKRPCTLNHPETPPNNTNKFANNVSGSCSKKMSSSAMKYIFILIFSNLLGVEKKDLFGSCRFVRNVKFF